MIFFLGFVIKVECVGQFIGDMLYYVRVNHAGVIEMYIKYFFIYFCYGGSLFCDCALLAYILETKVNNVIE